MRTYFTSSTHFLAEPLLLSLGEKIPGATDGSFMTKSSSAAFDSSHFSGLNTLKQRVCLSPCLIYTHSGSVLGISVKSKTIHFRPINSTVQTTCHSELM